MNVRLRRTVGQSIQNEALTPMTRSADFSAFEGTALLAGCFEGVMATHNRLFSGGGVEAG